MDTTVTNFIDALDRMNDWCKAHYEDGNLHNVERTMIDTWNAMVNYAVWVGDYHSLDFSDNPAYAEKFRFYREKIGILAHLIND